MGATSCVKCGNDSAYECDKCGNFYCRSCALYDKKGNPTCPSCNRPMEPVTEEDLEGAEY